MHTDNPNPHSASRALLESQVDADPLMQFQAWLHEASQQHVNEPTAMTLSTCGANGRPAARVVYLKGFKGHGLLFYTNYLSRKGQELEQSPYASLTFFWPELERQVRIEGIVSKIPAKESEQYFESRPEASRIGAWVSEQSQVIDSREVLEKRQQYYEERFAHARIRRPKNWGGYLLKPDYYEFWQKQPARLHDRLAYFLEQQKWKIRRLAP